jgi:MFS family permease
MEQRLTPLSGENEPSATTPAARGGAPDPEDRRASRPAVESIETGRSWIVALAALGIMSVAFGSPYIAVVALKPMAAELGNARSVPALAYSLAWLGTAVGGIAMGRIAERIGTRWTIMFGALMICAGLNLASRGAIWQVYVGYGVLIGLLGIAGMNAPLYVYVSHWFDRRRGTALALISSGQYVAGALWPEIFERLIARTGWHHTMVLFSVVVIVIVIPIAALVLRSPPALPHVGTAAAGPPPGRKVLGLRPNVALALLAAASFCCCVPMAMPQGHLVAFCSDLGISPAHGAAMLSVLLGTAFASRQIWGWVSDRIGGLRTVLVCSALQASAITALLFTQNEAGLFTVSAAFGFGFSGLIPAYVLAIRELFPAAEASWRVPSLLLCSGTGMAAGGWTAGVIYDHFGFYEAAFAFGLLWNIANLVIVGSLVLRLRRTMVAAPLAG